jgi:hypothetical protein
MLGKFATETLQRFIHHLIVSVGAIRAYLKSRLETSKSNKFQGKTTAVHLNFSNQSKKVALKKEVSMEIFN